MIERVLVRFEKYYGETPYAFLVLIGNKEYWFPWSKIRNFILNKKLGGNFECPCWLYKEKFGEEPHESLFTLKIEKHIPEKLNPVENNTIKELKK